MNTTSANGGNPMERTTARQACTVLYKTLPPLNAAQSRIILGTMVGECLVEWAMIKVASAPMVGGVAQFGPHRIAMIALDAPVRPEVLAHTVAVSPMPEEQRQGLMGHGAAIRLLYLGDAPAPLEQLTALYQVGCMLLLQAEGLGMLNEHAALAVPTKLVFSLMPALGSRTPPMSLWVGAVTFDMGERLYLVRTYGMHQMELPELAIYIKERAEADAAYHTLMNMGLYMAEGSTDRKIGKGDRADFKGHAYLLTDPQEEGPEYSGELGLLLLVEV
ncbi:MAG: hypothetical protein M3014_09205 [Chloroflexota bacterium]|nr:hypothetical protein [Chloroflexota bacterium]